jgi:hypothetical protein
MTSVHVYIQFNISHTVYGHITNRLTVLNGDKNKMVDLYYDTRYDYVTLIPLVLQLGLRIGPIQRMGAN